ncbi:MAG TPA: isoleucine--tRNA ligase, partial [Candidatus Wolfebacteria bacterium]|nr:isoleucine--tRNA ligase [Candidatus Wolfebacteria bacterium]
MEEKILKFWQENHIFEKSIEKQAPKGDFVFYDGPPFATGSPHYGHILASIIKDVIPRYQTMNGKKVPRKWGWDCHGLPIENLIEKNLNLQSKKDIEEYGIEKFNKEAQESVLQYADEWKKIISRIGRWVDMENDYKTMDWKYTESVWWVFKKLYDKGLIYEGYKSMHICPRCETTLSNFEITQNYQDIKDISITVKFELEDDLLARASSEPQPNSSGQGHAFILAWTTTPWTLPGNVALAINKSIKYQVVSIKEDSDKYIIAKDRIKEALKDKEYEVIQELNGSELIGKKYKPLFDYYIPQTNTDNTRTNTEKSSYKSASSPRESVYWENGWKIYGADFVSTEEGTGVVHIAPAFGEDDMNLGQKEKLPFIQHVSMDGKFKKEVKEFAGLSVKPKSEHQSTDVEIIKYFAKNNKLFSKESINHSYPFCWRCDTPLLNYAANSWFVKVDKIKKKLIKNNKKINWIPSHLRDGRFGKWLEGARDWAISRSRYWGAPLPIWKCEECEKIKTIGSIDDLKEKSKKSGNKYFAMRHGGSESNAQNIVSSKIGNNHHLTEKGRVEVNKVAKKLKKKKIDLIFSSDFTRTKETAEIAAENLGISKNKIIFDKRLREVNTGIFNGKKPEEYHAYFSSLEEKFFKIPPEGENLTELKNRMSEFLYDIESKYSDKNILIISHEYPIWLLFAGANGLNSRESVEIKKDKSDFFKTSEIKELDFVPLPHDKNYVLDLHRPYIDKIELECNRCKKEMKRAPEVFDCWFESGSMPYGQAHYPFENKKEFEKNFPAEFIAEGIDQTRGWFYTLLVLSTALFNKPAYKNVIANGIILAEDGQKMSKRLNNYPDPMNIIEKYGADALRYYFLSSPVVRGESLNFSEKGVDEVNKKVMLRLKNVVSFYKMYGNEKVPSTKYQVSSDNVLDKWILIKLNDLKFEVSKAMDSYELDKAVRPIGEFVDDLSTWYVRRSRERFKSDNSDEKESVVAALGYVLFEFSKLIAPFMPFVAENIYQDLKSDEHKNSVHLESWPIISEARIAKRESQKLLEEMKEVRRIVSLGLEARTKEGIKVRQPLSELRIKNYELRGKDDLLNLIKDEVNVKDVIFDSSIENEVELTLKLTHELIQEGQLREVVRTVQDLRKKAGYQPKDEIYLWIET